MSLMSYDEYVRLGKHEMPYVVRINSAEKSLFYFGEEHSFNPNHKQWEVLKDSWKEFIASSDRNNLLALTEGGVRPVASTEEEAILKYGGMGLVSFLADKEGIKVESPEPNEKEERTKLEERFSRDEIQYYYFARVMGQWGRLLAPKPNFEEYIESYLRGDEKESEWMGYDFSLDGMKGLHEKFFGQQFNSEDQEHFYEVSKPTDLKTRTNEVSRAVGDIRDEHIVKEIQRYWNEGKSIFALYGCTHVIRQESLLRETLGAN
jgi:hypothetical protein